MSLILTTNANPGTATWSANSFSAGIVLVATATMQSGNTTVNVLSSAALDGSPVLFSAEGVNPSPSGVSGVVYRWDGVGGLSLESDTAAAADVEFTVAVLGSL